MRPRCGRCLSILEECACPASLPLLDAAVDKALAHKPKPKSKPARKRVRRTKKIAQAVDV